LFFTYRSKVCAETARACVSRRGTGRQCARGGVGANGGIALKPSLNSAVHHPAETLRRVDVAAFVSFLRNGNFLTRERVRLWTIALLIGFGAALIRAPR